MEIPLPHVIYINILSSHPTFIEHTTQDFAKIHFPELHMDRKGPKDGLNINTRCSRITTKCFPYFHYLNDNDFNLYLLNLDHVAK